MSHLIQGIQSLYNKTIRPYLPRKLGVCNGVTARVPRLFDSTDIFPDYEGPLIDGIRARTNPGDDVVVVGGGYGVSTVVAAHETGESGSVESYEGSAEQIRLIEETISLNDVEQWVCVNHAIVGRKANLYSASGKAKSISPSELPDCDVFILDCEGCEPEVLKNMSFSPQDIIVETHAFLDAPEEEVREILEENGYDIIDRGIVDESKGVVVLTATA